MKKSEVLRMYWDEIAAAIVETYTDTLETLIRNNCETQYQIYIWDDGEIEYLFGPAGDNSFLQPKEHEERKLYYIGTERAYTGSTADYLDFKDMCEDMTEDEIIDEYLRLCQCLKREMADMVISDLIVSAEDDERDDQI